LTFLTFPSYTYTSVTHFLVKKPVQKEAFDAG